MRFAASPIAGSCSMSNGHLCPPCAQVGPNHRAGATPNCNRVRQPGTLWFAFRQRSVSKSLQPSEIFKSKRTSALAQGAAGEVMQLIQILQDVRMEGQPHCASLPSSFLARPGQGAIEFAKAKLFLLLAD